MVALQDTRTELIEKVDLEDDSTLPIPQENLNLAKQYGVTATPVLIITNGSGEKLEEFIGGVPITQNIQSMFDKYVR
jgi:thioredoxin-related protein